MPSPRMITVSGTVLDAGAPVAGAMLTFRTATVVRDAATDDVVIFSTVRAVSNVSGEITAQVPATDDPGFTPSGWTWLMELLIPGRATPIRYPVAIPYATPLVDGARTLKLSSLIPAQASAGMTLYATLAALEELAALVGEGGGGGVTQEEVDDAIVTALAALDTVTTAELSTALAGYATTAQLAAYVDPTELTAALSDYATTAVAAGYIDPAELTTALGGYATTGALAAYVDPAELTTALAPYITSVAAGDYVDPTELTAALAAYLTTTAAAAAYLPLTGGSVTGNVVIQASVGGKNYSFRTNGSNLDIEGAGADLFLSVWSDAAKAVTQRNYMRLESGAQLAHLLGRFVIAPSAFSGTFTMDADPATGVMKVGAANNGTASWGTLPFAARWNALGAPSTGTSRLGDIVLADDGLWECTVAGTPGTWKPVEVVAPWRPSDSNMSAWTFDPSALQGGTVLTTAGVSYVFRMRASTASITNILLHITAGGTGLVAGQCYATLHNAAGAQIGATADQATNWASGGLKVMALAGGPVAVVPGAWLTVRLWFNGTTGPTVSRGGNSSSAIINAGLAAPNLRFASADVGLTTLALAPATIGAQSGIPTAWWVALS